MSCGGDTIKEKVMTTRILVVEDDEVGSHVR